MNRTFAIGIAAAICAVGSLAFAGMKGPGTSVILGTPSSGVGFFWGTSGAVRGSANPYETISCRMAHFMPPGPNSNQVLCYARNTTGTALVMCTKSGPYDWNPLAGMTENSHVDVTYGSVQSVCFDIRIENNSGLPIIQP